MDQWQRDTSLLMYKTLTINKLMKLNNIVNDIKFKTQFMFSFKITPQDYWNFHSFYPVNYCMFAIFFNPTEKKLSYLIKL